jgi:hypothetical protein
LKDSLLHEQKVLQHNITLSKPPTEQVKVLESFIEKKMSIIAESQLSIQTINAKISELEVEVGHARQQLVVAKEQEQALLPNVGVMGAEAILAQLAKLLNPDVAGPLVDSLRHAISQAPASPPSTLPSTVVIGEDGYIAPVSPSSPPSSGLLSGLPGPAGGFSGMSPKRGRMGARSESPSMDTGNSQRSRSAMRNHLSHFHLSIGGLKDATFSREATAPLESG